MSRFGFLTGRLAGACACLLGIGAPLLAEQSVRANATLSVTFDEPSGDPVVAVAEVSQRFTAAFLNGPQRVASPFWNQAGKKALRLDAAKKQSVALRDIPYTDRADAVTLSFFFLNLHDAADAVAHGIVGKRAGEGRGTNYGINYVPASDVFQVYVNDGRGFRIAAYSARDVVGSRRLVHLTATLEVGDAPVPDTDKDRDDILVRLFVNGQPAVPKTVTGGDVHGADAWFTNVNLAGLMNDAPLTLGSSNPDIEHTSGVIDEFLMFARALSPSDAQRLFLEVAGPNGRELAQRSLEKTKPAVPPPTIESISQLGLQIGKTTQLTVRGNNLADEPRLDLPLAGVKQQLVKAATARRATIEVTVPADTPPGIYPLSIVTGSGISKAVGVALDSFPQLMAGDSAADRPATLPAAFSGLISGTAQPRVYFIGKAGQRVIAEVEARRIGSALEPVVEFKNAAGTSLAIEWGKAYLRGDARAEFVVPSDGEYYVELHDLAYNAPAESPFRLLMGDFRTVDAYFPGVVQRGKDAHVEPVGSGIPQGLMIAANLKGDMSGLAKFLMAPSELHVSGPLPPLRISDGLELLEVPQPDGQLQTIDARFADKGKLPIAVNGRLSKPGEVDRYALAVMPGKALSVSVDARSFNSPLEGHVSILSDPEGQTLATDGGVPGAATAGLQYQVPADVASVQLAVRDLMGRGGRHFVYRLRIRPAGEPSFSLSLLETRLNIPRDGRMIAEMKVDRAGYAGPIDLKVDGDNDITIAPKQLPAEGGSRKVLVTLTSSGDKPAPSIHRLRIVGQSVGVNPVVRRTATTSETRSELAGFLDVMPVAAVKGSSPLQIEATDLPAVLLKGIDAEWPILVTAPKSDGRWLRLTLVSSETAREDKARAGASKRQKPLVRAVKDQYVASAAGKDRIKVQVPTDIDEPAIDFAVRADVVDHGYSDRVLSTTYSAPFRMLVQDPVSLQLDSASLNLVAGQSGTVRGKIVRHADFKQPVTVALVGLPAGYTAREVSVAADKSDFEIPVTSASEPTPRVLPKVAIVVRLDGGKVPINQPIELKVAPAKK